MSECTAHHQHSTSQRVFNIFSTLSIHSLYLRQLTATKSISLHLHLHGKFNLSIHRNHLTVTKFTTTQMYTRTPCPATLHIAYIEFVGVEHT